MIIKTEELSGTALDWAVAEALDDYCVRRASEAGYAWGEGDPLIVVPSDHNQCFWIFGEDDWSPSINWVQGGPLVDEYDVWLAGPASIDSVGDCHAAWVDGTGPIAHGETKLIAAMRAIVAAKLGKEMDVPEEFL